MGGSLFLIYTGFDIARDAVDDLIGKPPTSEEVETIRQIVMKINGVLGVHDITVHSYGQDKFASVHVEIDADKTTAEAHDLSENVETQLMEGLNVAPTVHIDPVYPDNPMVTEVQTFLDDHLINDERITGYHDVRIVDTENHHVILFGIRVRPGLNKSQIIECCNEMKDSISGFPGYEVDIKVSHLYQY